MVRALFLLGTLQIEQIGLVLCMMDEASSNGPLQHVVGQLQLSPKQRQVTLLLATGHGSISIMEQLSIRPGTLRTHKRAIFSKLGVHSQVELVARLHAKALGQAD